HILHNAHERSGNVAIERIRETDQPHYPLSLFVAPEDELRLWFSYRPERFEAATIRRMLSHLQRILESMVKQVEQPVGSVGLLSAAERQQLLREWNDTKAAFASAGSVQELIAMQAAASPDRIAVGMGEQQLSYGELEERSNQLARYLRRLGVRTEQLVG